MKQIAIVLFDGAEELDFVGPWEVFTMLSQAVEGSCNVFTVSETGGQVTCAKKLRVLADHSFETCPPVDVFPRPGWYGNAP